METQKEQIEMNQPMAFPVQGHAVDATGAYCGDVVSETGMTLRDYFAANAMQGIFSNAKLVDVSERADVTKWVSARAYQVADAMLAARKPAE